MTPRQAAAAMDRGAALPRLAVVLSHPTQYYGAWFAHVAATRRVELRVFYLWDFGVTKRLDPQFGKHFQWDIDVLAGHVHEFVPNLARNPGTHHFGGLHNPELPARLQTWKPDAVLVFGYKYRSHLLLFLWARAHRIPLLFRGDSHLLGQPRPGLLKRWLLRTLFTRFAAVTYVGQANRAYFETFGVPARKLFRAPHAVDQSRFQAGSAKIASAAAALRTQLGIDPYTRVILFAGKHVRSKRPDLLLEAFLRLSPPAAALVFVGDGPEKPALQAAVADRRGPPVHFLPFANQSEMPARYALGDLFVLPSDGNYETWGLAVNEAMHMGRPCIVSDVVGCHPDLILPGRTGWVFRAGDSAELQNRLAGALALPSTALKTLGETARRHAATYNYDAAAEGLLAALDYALSRSTP